MQVTLQKLHRHSAASSQTQYALSPVQLHEKTAKPLINASFPQIVPFYPQMRLDSTQICNLLVTSKMNGSLTFSSFSKLLYL